VDFSPVHVIGASGRSGAALCRSLKADCVASVPVVRDAGKWAALGLGGSPLVADVGDEAALRAALRGARRIVCCAHASHAGAVLAAAPSDARFVFLGSTRKFTRWPDAHGIGVVVGERAFLESGRSGVMLHPTMIYGAAGEDNVQRLAALLRRLPVVPLPGGGQSLVQPIHQDDITRSVRAALEHDWIQPRSMVIAGPDAISYATFVYAVAAVAGLRRPFIVSVSGRLLVALAPLSGRIPGLPDIRPQEVRRLLEDKAFDINEMRRVLGIEPIPLAEGLARTFGKFRERRA
jgi:uncharacterized protein YbjT (DUF2867 family)